MKWPWSGPRPLEYVPREVETLRMAPGDVVVARFVDGFVDPADLDALERALAGHCIALVRIPLNSGTEMLALTGVACTVRPS